MTNRIRYRNLLFPMGAILALAGYFGPWVDHKVAGLVVTGLDLGEFVKFLVPVRNGEIGLWREGFYLPLFAISLALSLFAFRREMGYRWPMRILLLGIAGVAALNMLPPAWDPPRLRTPEFRLQTVAIGLNLIVISVSPFAALLPRRLSTALISILVILSLWFPIWTFLRILPTISDLYNRPLVPGWGLYLMAIGLLLLLLGIWINPRESTNPRTLVRRKNP